MLRNLIVEMKIYCTLYGRVIETSIEWHTYIHRYRLLSVQSDLCITNQVQLATSLEAKLQPSITDLRNPIIAISLLYSLYEQGVRSGPISRIISITFQL